MAWISNPHQCILASECLKAVVLIPSSTRMPNSIAKVAVLLGVTTLLLTLPTVYGFITPNDDGGHVHLGTLFDIAAPMICGSYVRGAEGGGVNTNPAGYDYVITGLTPTVLGNFPDHHWFHDTDGDLVVFDMGTQVSQVVLFPAIDHPPIPEEAVEGTIYATNNLADPENTWAVGDISTIYDPGWDAGWIADDWVTVWDLPGSYRYIGVHWGGLKAMIADGDIEFDALCGIVKHGVPEFNSSVVATLVAFSTLVIGTRAGFLRRKSSN